MINFISCFEKIAVLLREIISLSLLPQIFTLILFKHAWDYFNDLKIIFFTFDFNFKLTKIRKGTYEKYRICLFRPWKCWAIGMKIWNESLGRNSRGDFHKWRRDFAFVGNFNYLLLWTFFLSIFHWLSKAAPPTARVNKLRHLCNLLPQTINAEAINRLWQMNFNSMRLNK